MQVRDVAAGHGWLWIKQGFALFRRKPLVWLILIAVWFLFFLFVLIIPQPFGAVVFSLLYPVVYAGAMAGCQAIESGEGLEISHLFAGFRRQTRQLVTVGAVTLLAQILIRAALSLVGLTDEATPPPSGEEQDAGAVLEAVMGDPVIRLIEFAVSLPLIMAMWFTPPLLMFHSMSAFDAIRWSFYACIANIGPFVVYVLVTFVLAVLAALTLGLGFLVLVPTLIAATYTSYRDIFVEKQEVVLESS